MLIYQSLKKDLADFTNSLQYLVKDNSAIEKHSGKMFNTLANGVITGLLGIFVGSTFGGQAAQMSSEDANKLAMRNAMAKVIPLLDQPTKEKLIKILNAQNNYNIS